MEWLIIRIRPHKSTMAVEIRGNPSSVLGLCVCLLFLLLGHPHFDLALHLSKLKHPSYVHLILLTLGQLLDGTCWIYAPYPLLIEFFNRLYTCCCPSRSAKAAICPFGSIADGLFIANNKSDNILGLVSKRYFLWEVWCSMFAMGGLPILSQWLP